MSHASLDQLISTVGSLSTAHIKFLNKSILSRSSSELELSNQLSELIIRIKGDELTSACRNYLWTCDQLKEEMLFFYREGRYRYSRLEDAIAHVYSNAAYMEKYLDGLLLTQVLWKNQFDVIFHLVESFLKKIGKSFRHLEVGPQAMACCCTWFQGAKIACLLKAGTLVTVHWRIPVAV